MVGDFTFEGIDGVLFDFDGTLVHLNIDFAQMRADVEAVLPGYALSAEGRGSLYTLELIEECVEELAGQGNREAVARFRQDVEAAIVAIEMDAAGTAEVHPGVQELLQELRRRGINVGIVTRNCRRAVEHILRNNPLPHDVLLTRDDVTAVKPNPAHLLDGLRHLGIEPRRAVMVGDHPMDVRAGRQAGTRTVAVLTGYSPAERFLPEQPDLILEEVRDLGHYLTI